MIHKIYDIVIQRSILGCGNKEEIIIGNGLNLTAKKKEKDSYLKLKEKKGSKFIFIITGNWKLGLVEKRFRRISVGAREAHRGGSELGH